MKDGVFFSFAYLIKGNEDIVKKLINEDEDVNKVNKNDDTSLIIACKNGNIIVFVYIIKNHENINIKIVIEIYH